MTNKSRVRVEVHASKLKNVAGAFKGTSDPYAVISRLSSDPKKAPTVLGRTEVIKNSLSPKWTAHFDLDYEIGVLNRINVSIFDEVRKGNNKQMGTAMFEVGEVLGARGNTKAKKLKRGGTIFVRITKAPEQDAGELRLQLRGIKLKNVDGFMGKSDPFFELSAKVDSAGGLTWQPVYRSEHINNDLNPKWAALTVDLNRLCAGDLDSPILISVWDWEKNGKRQSMGSFETSVNGLLSSVTNGASGSAKTVDLAKAFVVNHRGRDYGKIVVVSATREGMQNVETSASVAAATSQVTKASAPLVPSSNVDVPSFSNALSRPPPDLSAAVSAVTASTAMASISYSASAPLPPPMAPPLAKPSFVDYLTGGCELEMCVAIDFTGSNGDPRKPGTLHYIHPDGQLNDYEKALTAIGSIVDRYDSDHKYPVLGFGAKYGGVVQHCFQVGPSAELDGIGGILDAYRQVFRTGLTMSGPTVFAEVLNFAAASARSRQDEARRSNRQAYKVLLILTDGAVTSVEETKHALNAASDAPLSVVIVGIGNADFSSMQFLDDFQSNGESGRDICQFVEFSKYKHDKSMLTRETLDEIPAQLVGYFYNRGIMPLPPIDRMNESFALSECDEEDIDLNLAFGPDGEVTFANYDGAIYDDSQYDTISTYKIGSAAKPFVPNAPLAPAQLHQPYGSLPSETYTSQPSHGLTASAYASAPQPPVYDQFRMPYGQQPVHAVPVQAQPVFHVQVPPGVSSGQQLQIRNPHTGQDMIVAVPHGVDPGGTFAVQY